MSDRSKRFGLTIFDDPDDQLDEDGWKFGLADRNLLDRLLQYAVESHAHTGLAAVVEAPVPPTLEPSDESGRLPAGATVYYRYSLIDERGQETLASDVAVFHTPTQIFPPGPPAAIVDAGSLPPGVYTYAVSAFTGGSAQETPVGRTITLTARGSVLLTMPRLPSGADGFNIYRKAPGDEGLRFLTATDAALWLDEGSVNANPFRIAPTENTTNSDNAVRITLEEGVPYSWKVYRTTDPSNWENSLLKWDLTGEVVDTGHATKAGVPPMTSATLGSAPKIALTDVAEVEGQLPPGMVTHAEEITFSVLGQVHAGHGEWPFVIEWDRCEVIGIRAVLGMGSAPAAQNVIVSLEKLASGEDVWVECLDSSEWAYIFVGDQIGQLVDVEPSASTESLTPATFMLGDAMRLMVRQEGAGATPTDSDLMVTVLVLVQGGSTTETYTWETS